MMTARSRGISQIGRGRASPQIRGRRILIHHSPAIIVMGSPVRALEAVLTAAMGNHHNRATPIPALAVTPTAKALPAMGNRSRGVAALMGAIRAAMGSLPVVTASRVVMGNHLEAIAPMGARILPPLAPRPDSPVPRIAAMVSRLTRQINPRIVVAITVLPGYMANRSRGVVAPTGRIPRQATGSNHGKTIPVAIANRKKP